MQRNDQNLNTTNPKTKDADIHLRSRANMGLFYVDCGISGKGTVTQTKKNGQKTAEVKFKLDQQDPSNSSLCYISLFEGYAKLMQTSQTSVRMQSKIDAGGVKTVEVDQEVKYSEIKTPENRHINSKFDIMNVQCELDVEIKKLQNPSNRPFQNSQI